MFRSLVILLVLATATNAQIVEVTMRSTARVAQGQPVTLGDVALIQGSDDDLRGVVVIEDADARADQDQWIQVTADEVTKALAKPRAKLLVRGLTCRVRVLSDAPPPVLIRTETGKLIESFSGPIVRDAIRIRIAAELDVHEDDLRLDFAERDARMIRMETRDLTVEVTPLGISNSMPMAVTLYDGEKIVLNETMRVGVAVRKEVLVARHPIERRGEISPRDFGTETRWVPPTLSLARQDDMAGATARASLGINDIIESRHVEPPIVVSRGDTVTVRCVSGTIVAKISARALADARDGDRINFEPVNGGRRFRATVNGSGRAVLLATSHKESIK